ncbi:CHAP domain-containing protein [Staphylococcus edaphicus]|nr:CHAP domain-containing protein [Staphylococcus edaphicus]UQW82736.1 CHAP domain-containing protein [Staphylococcus edaphicus]
MISSLNVIYATNSYAETYTTIEEAQKDHPNAQFNTKHSDGTFTYSYGKSNSQNNVSTSNPNQQAQTQKSKSSQNPNENYKSFSNNASPNNINPNQQPDYNNSPIAKGPHNTHNDQGNPVAETDTPLPQPTPPISSTAPIDNNKHDTKEPNKAYKKDKSGMITYIDMDALYDELQLEEFNDRAQTVDGKPLAVGNGKIIDKPSFTNKNNLYTSGQCTWYVFDKRAKDGETISTFWGDARNWAGQASASGFKVDHKPEVGAILQTGNGPYGHVAYVERVNSDGSIFISEMNWIAPYITSTRTISSSEVSAYNFIH